jgi:hypothetical protein
MTAGQQRSIARLQAFAAVMKRAPTAGECGAGVACHKRVATVPRYSLLLYQFGTFKRALESAGLTPRQPGARLDRTNWRKPSTAKSTARRYMVDPHWPLILAEAREALARRCA